MIAIRWIERSVALVCLAMTIGCTTRVTQIYGESDGFAAKCSPGGMTVFRDMVESRGFRTLTVRSLSPANMNRLNTLVWTPDRFPVHNKSTYDWLSQWMSLGNKTLIYIGRDFSPHAAYWDEIARQTPPSGVAGPDRVLARDQASLEQLRLDGERRANRPLLVMPWCKWNLPVGDLHQVNTLGGPWGKSIDAASTCIQLRSGMQPLRTKEINDLRKQLNWDSEHASPNAAPKTNPYDKTWLLDDSNLREVANNLDSGQLPRWTSMLTAEDNQPLIAIASEGSLGISQVVLVANNSLFSNYSMLRPAHRQLAGQLIGEFSAGSVGFLSGENDPMIRSDNAEEQQRGFEMLTVWPLNVVTIHAAFLGIATVIAAFPIFGRPKRLPTPSTSDFGQHLDAVGALMQRSGDSQFALRAISEYYRTVRGDVTSPWASMDHASTASAHGDVGSPFQSPESANSPQSPFALPNPPEKPE